MGIVRFALRFPHTFYVLAALILFLGITAIRAMPTDIFPEIRIPVVTVIWQETGLSTPEMEQRVTTYSQYAISANVNGIKNMEAQTLDGLSVQKIYFPTRRKSRPRDCADCIRDQRNSRAVAARDSAADRSAIQRVERSSPAN
jgi:multidrug efflux pump subunit AcrB